MLRSFNSDIPGLQVDIQPDIGVMTDGAGSYFVEAFAGNVLFEVTVTDGFCVDQGIVNITSDEEPDFPFDDIIQCGQDSVLLNPNGPDFYYYEWEGPGITDQQAVNPLVSLQADGEYFVTVSTSQGSLCRFSDSLSVSLSADPEFEIIASQIPVFCDGDSIRLSLDSSFPIMRWTDSDGNLISEEQEILLTGIDESVMVNAEVITDDGCSARDSIEVTFSGLPVINVSGNTSTRVCMGEDADLQVVSLDSVSWLDTDGNLLATGFQYTLEDVQEATTLTVVATNELGCESEIELNVGLHPDPMPDLEPVEDIVICPGMIIPVTLTTDVDVMWFDTLGNLVNEGSELLLEGINSDQEFVIVFENQFGCQIDTTITVQVDSSIVPDIDLAVLDSVQVCVDTDFAVELISSDSVSWFDLDGNLLNTGNSFSVESITDTLFFELLVVDSFNCQLRDTFQIDPFAGIELEISSSSQDSFYCEGEAISLGTSTNVNAEIQWFVENQLLTTGDSIIDYFPDGDLELIAIAMDQFGCMSTDSFYLSESQTEGEIIGDSLICISGSAELSFVPELQSDIFSISWNPSTQIIEDNGLDVVVQLDTTELFTVIYSNADDCITQDSFVVNVSGFYDGVMAFASPDEIFLGESTELSTDQDFDLEYEWTPAEDLDDAFSSNPIATPLVTTTYIVTVTDFFGCTDTAEVTVNVIQPDCDETDIFVPNAFTPNGDDFNDVFRVESNFIDEQRLLIYNRWGEEVFFSTDKDAEWDGTYKGQPVTADVYGFRLEIVCVNGDNYETQGNITVFR